MAEQASNELPDSAAKTISILCAWQPPTVPVHHFLISIIVFPYLINILIFIEEWLSNASISLADSPSSISHPSHNPKN
jgi:hypothetical protein